MERLHPGVYIEEIPSGVRPIEGVSTSNGAFIGKAEMGLIGQAKLVTSLPEFQTKYGGFLNDSYLSHGIFEFFNNGGKKAYIIRVAGAGATAAAIAIKDRKGASSLTIQAANEGAWGNKLSVVITDTPSDPNNAFSMQVLKDRSDLNPPLPPQVLETMEGLVMDASSPSFVEKVVATKSNSITAQADAANQATAQQGSSRSGRLPVGNGATVLKLGVANAGVETAGTAGPPPTPGTSVSGAAASTNPPADQRRFLVNLNNDGPQEVRLSPTPATGADVAAAIQAAVRAMTANNATLQPAYNGFTCAFAANAYTLTSGTTGTTSSVVVTNSPAAPISVPAGAKLLITLDGDGPHEVSLQASATGTDLVNNLQTAVRAIGPTRTANVPACANFTATYDNGNADSAPTLLLSSGSSKTASSVVVQNHPSSQNVAGLLRLGVSNGGTESTGAAVLRPATSKQPTTEYNLGVARVTGNIASVTFGLDGGTPGDLEHKTGLSALDTIRDVNIVCIPGISSADVVATAANYCAQRGDCFFIGDSNVTDDTVDDARTFVNSLTVKNSYSAVYYPWLESPDPTGASSSPIPLPPSGFIAGIYARIDSTRGVWKAPAGTEANVAGAVSLVADTTDAQQDFLNPIGVNVIRSFPASGIVVWGTRTLATLSNPEYRYVPVRRTAIFLEQSIYAGIQWAVFEPNDFGLWASLRLNIGAFMMQQFRAGAFQGKTPNDAFFVKCDETTTTQQDIDAGTVNILVGFAPLKPAEFVVLKLTQKAGQPVV